MMVSTTSFAPSTWQSTWQPQNQGSRGMRSDARSKIEDEFAHSVVNQVRSFFILLCGAPGFFRLRQPPPFLYTSLSPAAMSSLQRWRRERPERQLHLLRHHHPPDWPSLERARRTGTAT